MKTKTKIVIETIVHIEKKGRAEESGYCQYKTPEGTHCAFGRCMDMRKYKEGFETNNVTQLQSTLGGSLESLLKKAYRGHSIDFWASLQNLHDMSANWHFNDIGGSTLSAKGERSLSRMVRLFDLSLTGGDILEKVKSLIK